MLVTFRNIVLVPLFSLLSFTSTVAHPTPCKYACFHQLFLYCFFGLFYLTSIRCILLLFYYL